MSIEGEVPHQEIWAREDINRQPLRMSLRPPVRYSTGVVLELWLTRFELYARGAAVPETEWKAELLPLLDDESFRVVNQLRLVQAGSYEDVKAHLKPQFTGHLGVTTTFLKVRSKFYCSGQRQDVEAWCRKCDLCHSRKSRPTRRRA